MTTPVEKRNSNKFCEFHGEVTHNTDECMHLKRQIEEMIKAGKLTDLIKEIKQGGKDLPKTTKKGETSRKDKAMAILMVQPWQKVAKQKITQSFSPDSEISFPPLGEEDGMEGPMIIEAPSGSKEPNGSSHHTPHWFQWRSHMANGADIAAIKNRGCGTFDLRVDEFCGSKVTISVQRNHRKARYEENSSSPINGSRNAEIPGPRRSTYFTKQQDNPTGMVSELEAQPPDAIRAMEEKIKVAIHLEYPEQTIAIDLTLTKEGRKALCDLLRHNLNIFAWKPTDMTGVS
ncbi:hypothetical protein Tco_0900603 [Tanacetum coccineum]